MSGWQGRVDCSSYLNWHVRLDYSCASKRNKEYESYHKSYIFTRNMLLKPHNVWCLTVAVLWWQSTRAAPLYPPSAWWQRRSEEARSAPPGWSLAQPAEHDVQHYIIVQRWAMRPPDILELRCSWPPPRYHSESLCTGNPQPLSCNQNYQDLLWNWI